MIDTSLLGACACFGEGGKVRHCMRVRQASVCVAGVEGSRAGESFVKIRAGGGLGHILQCME